MAIETKRVQINYTIGQYSDALYYDLDEYNNGKIDEKSIEAEKQTRYDNWIYIKENPPVQPEPTPEDIQAQIDSMTAMVESFEMQKVELVNLKSIRIEEIAIAEALALEEKLLDEKPVEEPIGEVRG